MPIELDTAASYDAWLKAIREAMTEQLQRETVENQQQQTSQSQSEFAAAQAQLVALDGAASTGMLDDAYDLAVESLVEAGFDQATAEAMVQSHPDMLFEVAQGLADGSLTPEAVRQRLIEAAQSTTALGDAPAPAEQQGLSATDAFICQVYHPDYNPSGPPSSLNCGPASLAIIMNYLGASPIAWEEWSQLSAEQRVDWARGLQMGLDHPHNEDTGDGAWTSSAQLSTAIQSLHGDGQVQSGWAALDAQLEAGNPVVGLGYLTDGWRDVFNGGLISGQCGHIIAILGKTPDGNYVVADPASRIGTRTMSRDQLAVFFSDTGSPAGGNPSFITTAGMAEGKLNPDAPVTNGMSRGASSAPVGSWDGTVPPGGLPNQSPVSPVDQFGQNLFKMVMSALEQDRKAREEKTQKVTDKLAKDPAFVAHLQAKLGADAAQYIQNVDGVATVNMDELPPEVVSEYLDGVMAEWAADLKAENPAITDAELQAKLGERLNEEFGLTELPPEPAPGAPGAPATPGAPAGQPAAV